MARQRRSAMSDSVNLQHPYIPCTRVDCDDTSEHCHHQWCGAPKNHSIHAPAEPQPKPETYKPIGVGKIPWMRYDDNEPPQQEPNPDLQPSASAEAAKTD